VTARAAQGPGPVRAIEAGGRTVLLSNPDKALFPATGFTKLDLARYYLAVAPALLPHVAGRPVTLARFPDGVDAPGWYQTNCPGARPRWMRVASVRGAHGQQLQYAVLDEPAALVWAASMAAIELHPLLAAVDAPDRPRALVVDLDPGAPAGLPECALLALRLRDLLDRAGLRAFPKLSGGRGLHLHAPLDGGARFPEAKAFARAVARELAREDPARVTDRMPLAERAGKVLVDWRQNDAGRSLIAPYSLRAATVPVVAAPLRWDEVEWIAAEGRPLWLGPAEVLERLARDGDLLAPGGPPGGPPPPP
jgi:bifunctional non-homologous end joining protein LigD